MSNSVGANAFISSSHLDKIFGPNPTTARGQTTAVYSHPKQPLLIYASGRFIIVKNYLNPSSEGFVYRGHSFQTTVAKFSPTGNYVASCDISGKVRVWSWDNPEHLTKLEVPVFAGSISDIDWNFESNRIAAVGDGATISMKVFVWDSGNSAGELVGHNKRVTSVAFKPTRPFKLMTGSEDFRTIFFAGPPFKYVHANNDSHSNFVNALRYSPDGKNVISVSSDKKIQKYAGDTGLPTIDAANAHEGGIYAVAFSPDGSHFATASADKTVKIWNTESMALVNTIAISPSPTVAHAQVAILWTKEYLLSLSLNGDFNYLNPSAPTPERCLVANQTGITAFYVDRANQTLYTGSGDGVVIVRKLKDDYATSKLYGQDKNNLTSGGHTGKVVGIYNINDTVVSVGWDDKLRTASVTSGLYHAAEALDGQPIFLASSKISDLAVVLTSNEVAFYRGTTKVHTFPNSSLSYTPTVADLIDDSELALGGSDNKTHIYNIRNFACIEVAALPSQGTISALAYHPAGDLLAIGDSNRQVEVYERGSWTPRVISKWCYHTSKVVAVAWSLDGNFLASGGIDDNIFIWSLQNPTAKLQIPFAHAGGIHALDWYAEGKLVSAGVDAIVATWKVDAF